MSIAKNKVFHILIKILTWLLVAFTVFMMLFTIITVSTVDKNDRSIFGYKFYIVQTGSMSKSELNADLDVHFDEGDIIFVKEPKDRTAFEAGDIISFVSMNRDSYFKTITHMIREVRKDSNGKVLGYVTYGTKTNTDDEALVEPENILGVYKGKLPTVGRFFAYVKTVPGYIVCILVPFLLLILYNGVNVIRLFRKYKREQTEAMEAERAAIAEERKQNEEMLRELQALKEQLNRQTSDADSNLAEQNSEAEPTQESEPKENSSDACSEQDASR